MKSQKKAEKEIAESDKNIHAGHRERLRGRVLNEGLKHFEKHVVLELLLFYAIPRRDTNVLAHQLLNRYYTLFGVWNAGYDSLVNEAHLPPSAAALLTMIPQLCRLYLLEMESDLSMLDTYEKLGDYLCHYFLGEKKERVVAVLLNGKGLPCGIRELPEGDAVQCRIPLRTLAESCAQTNVSAVIFAHNHLNGSTLPSEEDMDTTQYLADYFRLFRISVKEHIIVSGSQWSCCMNPMRRSELLKE